MHVEYTYIRLCEKPKHTIVDLRRLKMTFCIDIQLGCCVVSQRALESSFLWFHNEHCNGFLFDVTRSTWDVFCLISLRSSWFDFTRSTWVVFGLLSQRALSTYVRLAMLLRMFKYYSQAANVTIHTYLEANFFESNHEHKIRLKKNQSLTHSCDATAEAETSRTSLLWDLTHTATNLQLPHGLHTSRLPMLLRLR